MFGKGFCLIETSTFGHGQNSAGAVVSVWVVGDCAKINNT